MDPCNISYVLSMTKDDNAKSYLMDLYNSENDENMTLNYATFNLSEFLPSNCTDLFNQSDVDYMEGKYEDPVYFSYSYRIIGTLFQGIIFLVGMLGNIMVVIVVGNTKSMHSPTNCYLVSLALADCIVLISSIPQEIVSYYIVGNQWIWGDVGCALLVFFQNLGINASSLSLTAFTVERYIAICRPFLAQKMCTVNRAKKIISGVWVFALIYCFPWLFLTSTFPLYYVGFDEIQSCEFKLSREAYLWYYSTDIIVFYVVPLLLSVVLYGLIARILYRSQSCKDSSKNNGMVQVDSNKTTAARVQVVKMLVVVVVIFALLWLPFRGMLVYNSFASYFSKERFMDLWFLIFAKTCIFINSSRKGLYTSAINPILYNAMSVKFRRAFSRTLSCGKAQNATLTRWNQNYATVTTFPSTSSTYTYNLKVYAPNPGRPAQKIGTQSNNLIIPCSRSYDRSCYSTFDIVIETADDRSDRSPTLSEGASCV